MWDKKDVVKKFDFERFKERVFYGRKYTPLYEKGIKEIHNKSMETTTIDVTVDITNFEYVSTFNFEFQYHLNN